MVVVYRWMVLLLALILGVGVVAPRLGQAATSPKPALTILISLDGFRADYLDRGDTPA
jgi:predicted AlkP superfamily pyrophosphatase or phosphodiesterase